MKRNFHITSNSIKICLKKNKKNECITITISHFLFSPAFEITHRFSIQFVFTKLVTEIRCKIIHPLL